MDSVRQHIRSFLKVSLTHPPLEVEFGSRTAEDGFARSEICYALPDGEKIAAFLFEPIGSPHIGAIVALHQHNGQWEIGKSEIAGLAGDPLQAFGPALARRGVTVLAPDCIGFESRLQRATWGTSLAPSLRKAHSTPEGWLQYYNLMAHRIVAGDLLIRKILKDSAAAISVLQSLTGSQHIGVVGHSFGGSTALFLAALDTRVSFCCASGSVCSYRRKLADHTALEMSLIIPGVIAQFDFEELVCCVAPRRIFVVSSEDDPLSADAEDVFCGAMVEFERLNCPTHIEHLRTPGGHALDHRRFDAIVDWLTVQAGALS